MLFIDDDNCDEGKDKKMSRVFCQNILHFPKQKQPVSKRSCFFKKLANFLCVKGLKSRISTINLVDSHCV